MLGGHAHEAPQAVPERRSNAKLSASAAHEINNPLSSILNLLHLVEPEIVSEKGRHYLRLVHEELCRISQIAHQSLDSKKPLLVVERINVGELLDSLVELYKQRFDSSGIAMQTHCSPNISLRTHTTQLRQVITNLLLNAADAMPAGGAIQVRVADGHEWRGEERSGIRVTIADNGVGIAPTMFPQIFRHQVTTKPGGHGIGLSVVQEFVEESKGRLRVRSSTQSGCHGTVFSLFVPSA